MAYLTRTEADAYFATRLDSSQWDNASYSDRTKALQMASKAVDRLPFRGIKKDPDQEHAFPRCYPPTQLVAGHRSALVGFEFAYGWYCEDAAPQEILDAVCEEAMAYLEGVQHSERKKLQDAGVQSISLGGLSETYKAAGTGRKLLSPDAQSLVGAYLEKCVSIT
jgi:hypothetical protein